MNLACLLQLLEEMPGYLRLVDGLRSGGDYSTVVRDSAKPYLIAGLHRELGLPALVLTPRPEGARQMQEQLQAWGSHPLLFPEPDSLPYEDLPSDPTTVQQRINALYTLMAEANAPLIVTSSHAATRKTVAAKDFASSVHSINTGMKLNIDEMLARWTFMGYARAYMVEVPGSFSQRGGIIDIYPPSSSWPARIELFGDTVESLRLFDPVTQRSTQAMNSITIVPASDESDNGIIIDYLPQDTIVVLDKPEELMQALEELDSEARWVRQERIKRSELADDVPIPYLTWGQLTSQLQNAEKRLSLYTWGKATEDEGLAFSAAEEYGGRLDAFLKDVAGLVKTRGKRIIIVSHQARRLSELLEGQDIIAPVRPGLEEPPPQGVIALVHGSLNKGWATDSTALFTDADIFGLTKARRRVQHRPLRRAGTLSQLAQGDYVVHIEHGIARFAGTTMIAAGAARREYLILEYAAGDRLYVPGDQIDRVGRYIGSSDHPPPLTRLGSQEWARTKRRVKAATVQLARELRDLYALREIIPGFAFSPDTDWQEEVEASFPYIETPDQAQAVVDIKHDMEQAKPMDRLVCGDVGYGKTEVALRAAFKAVQDDAQVAMLVPTTVLAQQHFKTFTERLAAFPVNVAMLSRFRSAHEQQEVIASLKRGTIDIVVGTHRLLQKDVSFKNLGLVVIDEEQRFGVVHKEHLKKMRREVDILTLTATPIPRTLYMSLSGIRDMSTMETPPEDRLPIKTTVSEYDEGLIREAILRELERGGQVFFVHNRVNSIRRIASKLSEIIPEARIAIAHGQMPEEELESVMLEFSDGHTDILLTTTIIESGLDIPNVNTLIVNDADKLGLAQLYQLRGRVGRGTNRAYAYFMYSRGKMLTSQARRRLQTIFEATELGAGFRIAMRDLEIRGAGNLLGTQQSGYIGAVGFDLYCRLLQQAVEELKEEGLKSEHRRQPPTIDLPLRAYIPEEYIADLDTRLDVYQQLASLNSTKHLEQMSTELEDRFGPVPDSVINLLYAIRIKLLAMNAGVSSVSTEENKLTIKMAAGQHITGTLLDSFQADGMRVGTNQVRLDLKHLGARWKQTLEDTLLRLSL